MNEVTQEQELLDDEQDGAVEQAVRQAMRTIEAEIAANEGVYPQNGGALSQRELARRAGIHYTTLHKGHDTLLGEVKTWLRNVEREAVIGRLNVRRSLAERVSDWKELCGAFLDAIRISELDRQQAEAETERMESALKQAQGERDAMLKMLEAVKVENEELRRALQEASGGKVVAFPSSNGRAAASPPTQIP